jgi:hypothetical protein
MKKILLLLFVSVFTLSCVDDSNQLPEDVSDSGWIELDDTTTQVFASAGSFEVPFALPIGDNTSGQTLTYNVELVNGSIDGLNLGNLTYRLEGGVKSGNFSIPLINDGSNYEIKVTLLSTSNPNYTIGIAGDDKKITHTFNVCGFLIDSWPGTYSVDEQFIAGPNAPLGLADFFRESYQAEIALDPSDTTGTKIIVTNSAGFNVYFDDDNTITFDACAQAITLSPASPSLALFTSLTVESSSFDSGTNTITVTGQYGGFGEYRFILTKM